MNVNILAWNVADGLTDPNRTKQIQETLLAKEPDIAILSEARKEDYTVPREIINDFQHEGYEIFDTLYNDQDERRDRHGLVVVARPELVDVGDAPTLAGRSALLLALDGGTQFMGAHFVDRTVIDSGKRSVGGEHQRVAQAQVALKLLGERAIIAGDLNAMHGSDKIARRLRVARGITKLLPSMEPGLTLQDSKLRRIGSQSQRLADMARGDTLAILERAGFQDANSNHAPTMGKNGIHVQLDYILVRGVEIVRPTEVHPGNGLSDHNMITATVDL